MTCKNLKILFFGLALFCLGYFCFCLEEKAPSEMTTEEIITELTQSLNERTNLLKMKKKELTQIESELLQRETELNQRKNDLKEKENYWQNLIKEQEKEKKQNFFAGCVSGILAGGLLFFIIDAITENH